MLRTIITALLIPILQRILPRLISAGMKSWQNRPQRQETGTQYERDVEEFFGRVSKIVDGDSLYVTGHKEQIRLWGVDAPEKHEIGYNQATQMLRQLAYDQPLKIEKVATDKYGRTLARCYFSDGGELNHEMIRTGVVKEYMRFTKGFYRDMG